MMLWLIVLGLGTWGVMVGAPEVGRLTAEWFEIRHVIVEGGDRVAREEVIEHLKLQPGETLLSFDPPRVVDRLRSHAWIKDVDVRRIPFHTVSVRITERRAVAVLRTPVLNLLLDDEGRVLSVLEQPEGLDLPVIVGIDPNHLIHGEAQSRRAVQEGIQVAGLVGQVFEGSPEVHVANPANVVASVQGVRFQFGSSPFEEKWELYRRIRPAFRVAPAPGTGGASGEIDLRYPGKVIVRERG